MYMFQAVMDCRHRLMEAIEALRGTLNGERPMSELIRLRFEMAVAARHSLVATQRLWIQIEHDIPDIRQRLPGYDRLKAKESELHVCYAHQIAAWPVTDIYADFRAFAAAKTQFLDDLCRHTRLLEICLFEPARKIMPSEIHQRVRAA